MNIVNMEKQEKRNQNINELKNNITNTKENLENSINDEFKQNKSKFSAFGKNLFIFS